MLQNAELIDAYLEGLQDVEEIFLEPILKVPHNKMLVRNIWVKEEGLITEVPKSCSRNRDALSNGVNAL